MSQQRYQSGEWVKNYLSFFISIHGLSQYCRKLNLVRSIILTGVRVTAGAIAMMCQGNMVRVGKKPVLSYVVACVTLFNSGKNEIMVRARGRSIPKAIEAVGMLRRSFLKELEIQSVKIGSEDIKRYNGREASISTIEITLTKREENASNKTESSTSTTYPPSSVKKI